MKDVNRDSRLKPAGEWGILNPVKLTARQIERLVKQGEIVHTECKDLPDEEFLVRIRAARRGEDGKVHPNIAGHRGRVRSRPGQDHRLHGFR